MDNQTKQKRLKSLLQKLAPDDDRIESLAPRPPVLESVARMESPRMREAGDPDVAKDALERLAHDKPLSNVQIHALEAIIIPGERPVVDIRNDKYLTPEKPFRHYDKAAYAAGSNRPSVRLVASNYSPTRLPTAERRSWLAMGS